MAKSTLKLAVYLAGASAITYGLLRLAKKERVLIMKSKNGPIAYYISGRKKGQSRVKDVRFEEIHPGEPVTVSAEEAVEDAAELQIDIEIGGKDPEEEV